MAIAAIGAVASLAGTAVSAFGAIQQGRAAANAAEYNAQVSEIMARDALKRGETEVEAHRRKVASLIGRQTAVMAARGLDPSRGSPLKTIGDTAILGELEARTIQANAQRESVAHINQASLQRAEGKNARSAGWLSAFGTVLGGIGDVASRWYDLRGTTPRSSAFG